jgi:hypothetical protein
MIPESPIWRDIILAIHKAGYNDVQIAKAVRCHSSTIGNIKNERFRGIKFPIGARILNLYERVMNGHKASS